MPRGRPPKPKPEAPKRVIDPPECPPWIEGEAAEEWRYAIEQMKALNICHKADRAMLESYVAQVCLLRACNKQIEQYGHFIKITKRDGSEVIEANPAVRILKETSTRIRAFCIELGLTPNARGWSRTAGVPHEDDEDDVGGFLDERFE